MLTKVEGLQLSDEHAMWLEEVRKIPSEIAVEMGIRSSGKRIVFEYDGFRKFRTPDKMFWIEPTGAALRLWNEQCLTDECSPETPLVITEGEFDACSWVTAGATHVVSVPNGGSGKPGEGDIVPSEDRQFAYLWDGNKLRDGFEKFKKIIVATDNDQAGLILRDEIAVRLGRTRCWYVTYPPGCKDANDVLVKYGADRLTDVMADAKPIVPNRLVPFSEIPRRANRVQYSSGWAGLDDHLRLQIPELMVVTGSPNSGKSTWTLNYVCNLARVHGIKSAILQFEDDVDRNREDIERYVNAWSRAGNGERGIVDPHTWQDRMFRTIAPDEENDTYNMQWIEASIEEAALRHDCKVVLIDPFNEIEHLWKVNESETQYTNNCLREIKKLCRRRQVAVIIVTHPTKSAGLSKPIEEWSLADVAGSAAWNNKADHGVVIWRESLQARETYVKVAKSKSFRTMGVPGTVVMEYDANTSTFRYVRKGQ